MNGTGMGGMRADASGWNLVRLADVPPTPWRNGGGSTRELLAWPLGQGADWRVRLSVAEVEEDGPFSSFPGVRRWFAVLGGAGVRLRMGGQAHHFDAQSAPFDFDGGAAVECTLVDGPTQDFNLMLRGGRGTMERLRGSRSMVLDGPALVALYAHEEGAQAGLGGDTVHLPAQALAWRALEHGGVLEVAAQDALWMEAAL